MSNYNSAEENPMNGCGMGCFNACSSIYYYRNFNVYLFRN